MSAHATRKAWSCAAIAVLAAAGLGGCATPAGDSAALAQNAIDSAARLAPPPAEGAGSTSQAKLVQTIPYNLGVKIHTDLLQRSAILPNGLKETIAQGTTSTGSGPVTGSARTVSLCGLVPLIQESGSPGSAGSLVFTGKAGAFVPVGGTVPMSIRQIATGFEASHPDLCKPQPGMAFSFKLPITLETNIPPFRRVQEYTETWSCQASAALEAHPDLKQAGGSLLLTCSITGGRADRPTGIELVYMPQVQEYFPVLVKVSDANYTNYAYTRPPVRVDGR